MFKTILATPIFAVCLWLYGSVNASAQLTLCNRTSASISTAVGLLEGNIWKTAGWINVRGGECRMILKVGLNQHSVYAYVVSEDGREVWTGDYSMCTTPKSFRIAGRDSCHTRGFEDHGFKKIPTNHAASYTLTLPSPVGTKVIPRSIALVQRIVSETEPYAVLQHESPTGQLQSLAAFVQDRFEKILPRDLDASQKWVDVGSGIVVHYRVWRSRVTVTALDGTLSTSVRLFYWVQGGRHIPILGPLEPRMVAKLGSCGVDHVRMIDLYFRTMIAAKNEHLFTHTTVLEPTFLNLCTLTAFGYDASPKIRELLLPELQEVALRVDRRY